MNSIVVISFLLHLLNSFLSFPVPISGVKRFDVDHVVSYRHGHNGGAPAQMRIMKPSITVQSRYKKSLADAEGSERHSITQKAPANTPDEEHKLTKRDVAPAQHNYYYEQQKDQSTNKKRSNGNNGLAAARENVDQRWFRRGAPALSKDLDLVPNDNLESIPSAKHVISKKTLTYQQGKSMVSKTRVSSEDGDGQKTPDSPAPGFVEAPS